MRQRIRRPLSVTPLDALAFGTAALLTFVAFTVGGAAWLLASPPAGLVYLVGFGAALIAAFGRSRWLPHHNVLRFVLPTVCSAVLVVVAGWAGIQVAYLANDTVFHIPVKEFRS